MREVKREKLLQVNGAGIFFDLDNFKEIMKKMGWTEFKPNAITGNLTQFVKMFASKHNANILWGLDQERGTEEAYLEVVEPDPDEVYTDLEEIRKKIEELGKETKSNAHLSIGVAYGKIGNVKPRSRRELTRTPMGSRAWKALHKAKKIGGNKIIQI
jgi:GGDEF domain-containing protein